MIVRKISAGETYETRKKVLRENIPLPYKFDGDLEEETIHLGVFLDENIVGVASFMQVQLQGFDGLHYQLRGMATLQAYQGKGIGGELLLKAEEILKKNKCKLIWCNARKVALKFYKRNGYVTLGEEFSIQYIGPHFKMFKEI